MAIAEDDSDANTGIKNYRSWRKYNIERIQNTVHGMYYEFGREIML